LANGADGLPNYRHLRIGVTPSGFIPVLPFTFITNRVSVSEFDEGEFDEDGQD
jgi:hypothetical protein